MNVSELLMSLNEQGVRLWSDRDKLKVNAPNGVLTPEVRADIASRKSEIIAFLRECDRSVGVTSTGLSLSAIGRLIGGFSGGDSIEFKSPTIDPNLMAKQLKVTFRPLPKGFNNEAVLRFRDELEAKLIGLGVRVVSWEEATRDFSFDFSIFKWKKKVNTRVVKPDVNAVIDVERPSSLLSRVKGFLAENFYQFYSRFVEGKNRLSVAKITQLIGWAEDHAIQRLEDPTSTQVILLTEIDKRFVDSELSYQKKIAIGVNTIVKNFSEIVIGVSDRDISILNMNLSDSLFPREEFDRFVFKSLIPKIYVPIAPISMSRLEMGKYNPNDSVYAKNLVKLSKELAATGLFPSGFKLGEVIKRKSHRDIVDSIVNGRTGVSYGFVAYAEPPQYIGSPEISEDEWMGLLPVDGFSSNEVRQNEIGRRYIKTKIENRYAYKQIPNIWLVSSRSGADKTNLSLENDITRIGLKDKLCFELPQEVDPSIVDIKPSYDIYVMVAIALSAALYAPELIENGMPMIHFHGYPSRDWFGVQECFTGIDNPSVPCGTFESGVFNFLGVYDLASKGNNDIRLACLIEPDHGANIVTSRLDYLLDRLAVGVEKKAIELGGRFFGSLVG